MTIGDAAPSSVVRGTAGCANADVGTGFVEDIDGDVEADVGNSGASVSRMASPFPELMLAAVA